MEKITVIDLFAGAGGLSCGFTQTGCFDILVAVEIDKHAKETFNNFHKNTSMKSDIKCLDYSKLKENYGNIDVVIGGPPCQGFSNANRQKNQLISGNNQLVKEYIKAIEKLNPRAFVMENVKTIASKKHKFFYSLDEKQQELNDLAIKTTKKTISISKSLISSNEFKSFLLEPSLLSIYALPKHIYSRFNSMLKKSSSQEILENYMIKHKKEIQKIVDLWDDFPSPNWCEDYKNILNETKDLLEFYCKDEITFEKLKFNLKVIVETQKAIYKLKEIFDNNVELIDLRVEKGNICVDVETYNVIEYIIKKLRSFGYKIDYGILNAAHFGVPQTRERFFIIGVKEDETDMEVQLPTPFIKSENDYFTIGDAIIDLEDYEPLTNIAEEGIKKTKNAYDVDNPLQRYYKSNSDNMLYNHITTKTRGHILDRFKQLKPGQNFHNLEEYYKTTYSDPSKTQNTIYKRLDYSTPSGTVLNVRKSMWIHPTKNRAISIREAARLQSFPDDFIFYGPKDAQYQQIGNAVPPLLGRAVAEKVLYLLGLEPDKKLGDIFKTTYKNKTKPV